MASNEDYGKILRDFTLTLDKFRKGEKGDVGGIAPVVQTTGDSGIAVMSQKAVTEAIDAAKAALFAKITSLETQLHILEGRVTKLEALLRLDAPVIEVIEVENAGYTFEIKEDWQSGWDLYINGEKQSATTGIWHGVTKVGVVCVDSDGLLLLTEDGGWGNPWLRHPGDGSLVEKELTEDATIEEVTK